MIYRVPPQDPRAAATRASMRAAGNPRDLASGTLRLAFHMSEWEYDQLVQLNPDSLGAPDPVLAKLYWHAFVEDPASAPFRVNERI